MRIPTLISALCAVKSVVALQRTAQIYIQPVASNAKPEPLAEISYDPAALSSSSVVAYEAPELDDAVSSLLRIGIYDAKSSQWTSGTTLASSENFSKGYAPNLLLSVDSRGEVLSAAVKGVRIDAGQTRDFGPQAVVLVETKGKQPELNKPVVLSPEGKKVEEVEKTFLQKYVSYAGLPPEPCLGDIGLDHMLTFIQVLVASRNRCCLDARWRGPGEIETVHFALQPIIDNFHDGNYVHIGGFQGPGEGSKW